MLVSAQPRRQLLQHLVAVGLAVLAERPADEPSIPDGDAIGADEVLSRVRGELPRGWFDYNRPFRVAREIDVVLDWLEGLLDAGKADLAEPALRYATERIRKLLMRGDDSSGDVGATGQRAVELHARACIEGTPDRRRLGRWLAKFRADSPGWPLITLSDYADALRAEGVASYRAAVAKISSSNDYELRQMRIELADHDGDLDEAIRLLGASEYGPPYREIIDRLRAAGRGDDAMQWLDHAVADGRLGRAGNVGGAWISPDEATEWYLASGRAEDALRVARDVFTREGGLAAFQLLLRVAERCGDHDAQREWALAIATARAAKRRDGSEVVQIALADNDLAAAWAAYDRFGARFAWRQLADASSADLPIAAADLYRPELDELLAFADTSRYPPIAKILRTMRDLYARVGEEATIDALVQEIRVKYQRRTSLIAQLDRAKL